MQNMTNDSSKTGIIKCDCGNIDSYERLPLIILTGASGVGKSTIGRILQKTQEQVVILENDILWNDYYNKPEEDYKEYRETWLRLCKNIHQIKKSVVLVGCGVPDQFEKCDEREFFSRIIYIGLVTSNENLKKQLKTRPEYRECGSDEYIKTHQDFNNWIKNNAKTTNPNILLVDLEDNDVNKAANAIMNIVNK